MCVIFLLPVTVGVAAGVPTMTVSRSNACPNEEVDITVSLSDNPGVVGMTLAFEYDATRLNLLSIEESGLSGIWQKGTGVAWASSTGDSVYNGVFLTLKFMVLDTAEAGFADVSVKYAPGDICNNDLEDVNFKVTPGGVDVQCTDIGEMGSNDNFDDDTDMGGYGIDTDSTPKQAETPAEDGATAVAPDEEACIANNNGIISSTVTKSAAFLLVGATLIVLVALVITARHKRRTHK